MKGYAIEVRLLEWAKSDGHETIFKKLKSHYLGSFSNQGAERTYKRLSTLLWQTNPVTSTKTRRTGRGKRSRS